MGKVGKISKANQNILNKVYKGIFGAVRAKGFRVDSNDDTFLSENILIDGIVSLNLHIDLIEKKKEVFVSVAAAPNTLKTFKIKKTDFEVVADYVAQLCEIVKEAKTKEQNEKRKHVIMKQQAIELVNRYKLSTSHNVFADEGGFGLDLSGLTLEQVENILKGLKKAGLIEEPTKCCVHEEDCDGDEAAKYVCSCCLKLVCENCSIEVDQKKKFRHCKNCHLRSLFKE